MRVNVSPEQVQFQAQHQASVDLGAKVKFFDDRYWWTVQAVSEHFAALTRARPFHPDEVLYTVIDWNKGIRGPCNLLGQGYGDGVYDQDECAEMLQEFENHLREDPAMIEARAAGKTSWVPSWPSVEVSYRNRVALDIERVKR